MLKNWICKTKQIKKKEEGFKNHVNYLTDENRSSHEYSKITVLKDGAANILNEIDARREYRRANGLRGGGISNYATSFIMTLPTDVKQPTEDQWQQIGLYAIKRIAKAINVDYEELKKVSHIVLHDESNGLNKSSHIHVLVSNVLNNEVIKGVSQYRATKAVKDSMNYSVMQLLNEDNNKYQPKNSRSKPKPLHISRAEKADLIMHKFSNFAESVNSWLSDVFNRKKAITSSTKAAKQFDEIEALEQEKLTNKLMTEIEDLEDFEEPKLLEIEKITPKTKRKRRRRT